MKKITARVGSEEFDVSVERGSDGTVKVKLRGSEFKFSVAKVGGALSLIDSEGRSFDIGKIFESEGSRELIVNGRYFKVELGKAEIGGQTGVGAGALVLSSPISGLIKQIFVKIGDEVKEGQPLVVLEAMKMLNEMKAPFLGKIVEVYVKEGETINSGARILKIQRE